jgi:PTH1 family peptidyl-tRNA hydrolase
LHTATPIQLIVGLGNPGQEYETTRHNAGAWFVAHIANQIKQNLRFENKFKGQYLRTSLYGHDCHLLIPTTFMNLSGQAVASVIKFFKIPVETLLVAHDDLDLPAGIARLKLGGGHGGHNGLRDIMAHLNQKEFHRLRIGIGHPGSSKDVVNYVLQPPRQIEKELIDISLANAMTLLPEIISGHMQKAMKELHTKE